MCTGTLLWGPWKFVIYILCNNWYIIVRVDAVTAPFEWGVRASSDAVARHELSAQGRRFNYLLLGRFLHALTERNCVGYKAQGGVRMYRKLVPMLLVLVFLVLSALSPMASTASAHHPTDAVEYRWWGYEHHITNDSVKLSLFLIAGGAGVNHLTGWIHDLNKLPYPHAKLIAGSLTISAATLAYCNSSGRGVIWRMSYLGIFLGCSSQ
jgi:hypothetical protein